MQHQPEKLAQLSHTSKSHLPNSQTASSPEVHPVLLLQVKEAKGVGGQGSSVWIKFQVGFRAEQVLCPQTPTSPIEAMFLTSPFSLVLDLFPTALGTPCRLPLVLPFLERFPPSFFFSLF